jgi:hypothetical protein
MKKLAFTFALALGVIGGAVAVAAVSSTLVISCPQGSSNC